MVSRKNLPPILESCTKPNKNLNSASFENHFLFYRETLFPFLSFLYLTHLTNLSLGSSIFQKIKTSEMKEFA